MNYNRHLFVYKSIDVNTSINTELLTCKTNGTFKVQTYTNVNIYNELHRKVQPPHCYAHLSTRSLTQIKANLLPNYTKVSITLLEKPMNNERFYFVAASDNAESPHQDPQNQTEAHNVSTVVAERSSTLHGRI